MKKSMKKIFMRYGIFLVCTQVFVFISFLLLVFYTRQVSELSAKLIILEVDLKSLESQLKKQTELVITQNTKIKTMDIQIGAIRRNLSNQATEINRLDNVTIDLTTQKEIESPANDITPSHEQSMQERVVEMPILEDYQIVLPESQKVFNK